MHNRYTTELDQTAIEGSWICPSASVESGTEYEMAGRWMSNAKSDTVQSRSFDRQDVREGDFDHKAIR